MPTPVDGRRRLDPEERSKLLIDIGVSIFAAKGIGRAVHADVAENAGVSVATVFNYMKTREIFVETILQSVANDIGKLISEVEFNNEDDSITAAALAFIDACNTNSDHMTVMLEMSTSSQPVAQEMFSKLQKDLIQAFAKEIGKELNNGNLKKGLPAKERAEIVFCYLMAMVNRSMNSNKKPPSFSKKIGAAVRHIVGYQ